MVHRFIAMKGRPPHLLWNEWIHNNVSEQNIVFLCSNSQVAFRSLESGCGISAVPRSVVKNDADLIEIAPHLHWNFPIWALVHRDMFNLAKIKAFIELLQQGKDKAFILTF
ncbi:LysR substrate-binding domain-containing protein [Vibrio clamense]|uniref:LysR substrate-binding domain-containing protein n=1 Tax=Vibrio clamense TaxID=2910254 RepID=UPI003D20F829